jgi:methyltransferase (TIGR00027 family)
MSVAQLRYIQSIHESPQYRHPDMLVQHFIPVWKRWHLARLGRDNLSQLRAYPFYYYLIARTHYYDHVVNDTVVDGVQQVVNVGCGWDTRVYRFQHLLRSKGVHVLECDLPEILQAKQRIAKRWRSCDYVEYVPLDLNNPAWPELEQWLGERTASKALVVMEGVSPYVNTSTFGQFLRCLATTLAAGSHIAYDFKIRGINDELGRVGRTQSPFRLSRASDEVAAFHEAHGLHLERLELSSELCARLLPGLAESMACWFSEDGLVRLQVGTA